jgi:phage terminase large subunit-like protein
MTVPVHESYVAEGFVNHNTGKGFATSNALVEWALAEPGDYAAIAPTLGDARKIVTEGESGLLVALGDDLSHYNKSEFILYLKNGSRIILAGAEKPDRIRGLNLRGALIDELASFGAKTLELWNEALMPALRIGRKPRVCIATTPRRGNPILKDILKRFDEGDPEVLVVRGTTKDNAENLSDAFITSIYRQYAGTRMAAQELEGLLLDEVDGALLSGDLLERNRIITADDVPPLHRIVVGVDPAVTSTTTSDMTGIVVCGIGPPPKGWVPPSGLGILSDAWHLYILEDRSLRHAPETWARRVLVVAEEWAADCITAEVNQGGDLVSSQVRMVARASGLAVPRIHQVRASVGKAARAEPVAALFEQDRAHMVGGFPELEDEWCSWVPGSSAKSPDRLDACVWAAVELFPELGIKPQQEVRVIC